MKITKEIFCDIIRGAYKVYEDENGCICTKRFTDKQTEVIAKRCPGNVFHHAGMRLDLITDAESFSMAFKCTHLTSRIFLSIDIYEDSVMTFSYKSNNIFDNREGSFKHTFEKKGEKRVTVHLPYSAELCFENIELEGESFVKPYEDYRAFAYMIGDSITQGFDAEITSQTYVNRVISALDIDAINQGVGGYVFCADSLDPELFDGKKLPDIITVAYGTNDWSGKTCEDFCRDTDSFLARLHELYPDIPSIIITPVFRAGYYIKTKAGTFDFARDYIRDAAKKYENMYVLDGDKLVPHSYDYFRDVRLHPNDAGFATYGAGVAAAISEVLNIKPVAYFI